MIDDTIDLYPNAYLNNLKQSKTTKNIKKNVQIGSKNIESKSPCKKYPTTNNNDMQHLKALKY